MAENSKIEWTDHTFNPWMGCTKVSPACANCYAERDFDHRYGKVKWGNSGTRVLTSDANWQKPLQWNRTAESLGVRYRVFCASLADVFEDWHGPIHNSHGKILNENLEPASNSDMHNDELLTMDAVRRSMFDLIDRTPNLDWLLLTKRPENISRMWPTEDDGHSGKLAAAIFGKPGRLIRRRDNVWLGASVENQSYADKRIPELRLCRNLSPVLFLSCEPLVGPFDLWPSAYSDCPRHEDSVMDPTTGLYECCEKCDYSGVSDEIDIDWVIAGGESGPDARPCDPAWFLSLRDQCQATGTPFHFKQWGEFDEHQVRVGKKNAGRLLDGVTHDGFPHVAV